MMGKSQKDLAVIQSSNNPNFVICVQRWAQYLAKVTQYRYLLEKKYLRYRYYFKKVPRYRYLVRNYTFWWLNLIVLKSLKNVCFK